MKYIVILIIAISAACVSHIKQSSTQSFEDLIRQEKDVLIEGQTFQQDIDFTQLFTPHLVSEGVYQVTTNAGITFKNCVFKGKVIGYTRESDEKVIVTSFLKNLSFINCVFENEVNFRANTIRGKADFSKSAFSQKSNFEESTFFDDAIFTKSIFFDEARFQNAFFNKKLFFINAEFQKVTSFQNASFMADVHFSVAKFYGYTALSLATFHQHAFFNYAEFHDKATFNKSSFRGRCEFLNAQIQEGTLKDCTFWGDSKFDKLKVNESLSLENAFFITSTPDFDTTDVKIHFRNTLQTRQN